MKTAEIRQRFLKFFERNRHQIVDSSAVVPHNDPSLLFTNAGMVQFKDVFLGKDKRDYSRATTVQKCLRAGGKHNDLENVGFTARHHTFFEMLGNFSFGDYFKKEAIAFAWELSTKDLKLPVDKIYVTVHEKDDEAYELWQTGIGIEKDHLFRLGDKDNFWSMGDTGPCGPCSELYFDRGEKYGCGKPNCQVGCDCDRYMEYWNLVFMQFNRDASGAMTPLPKPSVDTGAGLERLASILQDAPSNYDIDIFVEIIEGTKKLLKNSANISADKNLEASFRVIADHARAATFLIADGVFPSNEGRGYVLRRIIRRAIRHGKKVGFTEPFLHKVCDFVIAQMHVAYPETKAQRELIYKCVCAEQEQFFRTLENGLELLGTEVKKLAKGKPLSGAVAFKLYDTFGFPLDLTRVICEEHGASVDEAGFDTAMEEQKNRSRESWKGSGEASVDKDYHAIQQKLKAQHQLPVFLGYSELKKKSECVAVLARKDLVQEVVFKETPFYGESGGQIGDRGWVKGEGFLAEVIDVQKPVHDLIVLKLKIISGSIEVGKSYEQEVALELRQLAARNHTATHMLHLALRQILGAHVKQAGSLVTPEFLRFDFTHFQALAREEIQKVEDMVNEVIWKNEAVSKKEMSKDDAIASGAVAMFGEKYGDRVRVVRVGDSVELCGGTHVDHSAEINLFKISTEASVAAGVRRITGFTSKGAFEYLRARDSEAKWIRERLNAASGEEVVTKLEKVFATEKELRRQIEKSQSENAGQEVDKLLAVAKIHNGSSFLVAKCDSDASGIKKLRDLSERMRQKRPDLTLVLGMEDPQEEKAYLLAALGDKAPKTISANDVIQAIAPFIEGRGGGKADQAQAGGTKKSGLLAALKKAEEMVSALHK